MHWHFVWLLALTGLANISVRWLILSLIRSIVPNNLFLPSKVCTCTITDFTSSFFSFGLISSSKGWLSFWFDVAPPNFIPVFLRWSSNPNAEGSRHLSISSAVALLIYNEIYVHQGSFRSETIISRSINIIILSNNKNWNITGNVVQCFTTNVRPSPDKVLFLIFSARTIPLSKTNIWHFFVSCCFPKIESLEIRV